MQYPDPKVVRQMVDLLEQEHLAELTIVEGDAGISVRAQPPRSSVTATPGFAPFPTGSAALAPAPAAVETPRNVYKITSPMVGIFYRCGAPDAEPFIEVGKVVEEGETVGLIEAMKVFNEIQSEVRGRVAEIPAKNEQLVGRGDPLVVLELL